jgi:hypothetical protein
LLGDGWYAAGAFSFWSVLGLFLIGNDNNGVVYSLGSVPRWYFLWGPFRGGIFFERCYLEVSCEPLSANVHIAVPTQYTFHCRIPLPYSAPVRN